MLIRADFTARLSRPIIALTAGMLTGLTIQELCWLLLDALNPAVELDRALLSGSGSSALLPALILSWLLGGFVAGLMAGLIAPGRTAANLCAVLLCGSAGLLLWLAWPDDARTWLLALTPASGALLGSALAHRLQPGRAAARRVVRGT